MNDYSCLIAKSHRIQISRSRAVEIDPKRLREGGTIEASIRETLAQKILSPPLALDKKAASARSRCRSTGRFARFLCGCKKFYLFESELFCG